MGTTVRAVIGLGANVGDAAVTIRDAIRTLAGGQGVDLIAVSPLYATTPVGVVEQAEFRNAVVLADVRAGATPVAGALDLLVQLKAIERALGRRRGRRWGPREIDLDLEAYGDAAVAVERPPEGQSVDFAVKGTRLLIVPHPEAHRRLFVLAPWAEVAPDQRPPGWDESVREARDRRAAVEGPHAVRRVATWDGATRAWMATPRRDHRGTDWTDGEL